ncbi:hypothetical protein SAMN05216266_101832 [Amycolatopsis marina]|uniref:Uncharacterized protein n=1 Tax=Amycolatopsis marina TaxID=490629 RepID=A0A1I0W8S6_9PSEU|nr:hypothetical protein [Amycolatopsis marina]SFA84964.1 hypothetical protein SAMN05216266_101832 [Amycolatopsis marina]
MERRERDANWHWTENSALNPTTRWQDTPETVDELHLLVKSLAPERIELLRIIADGKPHTMSPEEEIRATFLNRAAEAFGFVPMIEIDGRTCSLVPEIRAPLRKAFEALATQHARRRKLGRD